MHYFKLNIGDYHKKAGRLSMLEHGAYTLLMHSCYDRERFPTFSEAIDWCWARTEAEIAAVEFVLSRFFVLESGVYVQDRIRQEIELFHGKSTKNKEIALEREKLKREVRARNVHETARNVHETAPNQEPLTINQEPLTKNQELQSQTLTSTACPASQGDHAPQVENKTEPEATEPATTTEPKKLTLSAETIPYAEIVSAYREALPELAGVQRITDTRKRRIKTLWMDRKKAGKYATTDEGIAYWKRYFAAARQSDFLMGRMDGAKWSADFDFLLSEKGFNGVIDGKYKNREAA